MNDELMEFKRAQREALLASRERNAVSILSSERTRILEEVPASDEWRARQCPHCLGLGKIAGLFSRYDCHQCEGTGFVLDDPVKLIHHLLAGGRKLRHQYRALERDMAEFRSMWTESEIADRQERQMGEKINSRFD